jgi:hypothetical protein
MSNTIPKARKSELVIQELDNEILIYDLQTDKVFSLNETSALVWELATGDRNVTEIAQIVSQKLNFPTNEDLIWLALEQLKKENLIEENSVESSPFIGMKRREIIKKVGLSTLLTLPLIVSLTTPTAAQSGSSSVCSPVSCNCTIMFSSPMTTCSSVANCMSDTIPTCMCNNLTCTGSGLGGVTCGNGTCGP